MHTEGVKARAGGDKSWTTTSKDRMGVNDAESSSGHDNNALFGDIFSDIGRKFVTSNGHEQPCSAYESVSDSSIISLQGSMEVLTFLKGCFFSSECIFSSNWHYSIFE